MVGHGFDNGFDDRFTVLGSLWVPHHNGLHRARLCPGAGCFLCGAARTDQIRDWVAVVRPIRQHNQEKPLRETLAH